MPAWGTPQALAGSRPEVFTTGQGSPFTSVAFTGWLEQAGVQVSMDGRGRALDNIFVERLWGAVKYEDVLLKDYQTVPAVAAGLREHFRFYHEERLHQSPGYRTPHAVYRQRGGDGTPADGLGRKDGDGERSLASS